MFSLLYTIATLSCVYGFLYPLQNARPLAFIASGCVLVFATLQLLLVIRFARNRSLKLLSIIRKFLEYTPIVLIAGFMLSRALRETVGFAPDVVLVVLWFVIVALNFFALFITKPKRFAAKHPEFQAEYDAQTAKKKTIFTEIIDWIDVIVWSVLSVFLLHLFLFQLYTIPTESMVPTFMVNDRVFGVKVVSGPTFPLSSVRLPQLKKYKRGDVVIIQNPNYPDTPKERLKTFVSQIVYFFKLTRVNLNVDEAGNIKADPLVKRIVGMPGEKLMLVDGVLYKKTAEDAAFTVLAEDAQYALWNVSSLPASDLRLVRDPKLLPEQYRLLESIESQRINVNIIDAYDKTQQILNMAQNYAQKKVQAQKVPAFEQAAFREMNRLASENELIARDIYYNKDGFTRFSQFMNAPYEQKNVVRNLYETRSANLNMLIKLSLGNLVVRNLELYAQGAQTDAFDRDTLRLQYLKELANYAFYLRWTNQRNMNEFPAGTDEYIPQNAYFMLGDNRMNSTDMRHGYEFYLDSLDAHDDFSVNFVSNIDPKYLTDAQIIGNVAFRFWPPSRFGGVK